jgi:hypothetical protein
MSYKLKSNEVLEISEFIRKYEKYKNLYNSKISEESIDSLVEDIMNNLEIDSDPDSIRDFVIESFDLSEGISIVMAPNAQFQYTDIDQVQRFQY